MKGLTGWIILAIIILAVIGIIGISLSISGGVVGVELDLNGLKTATSIIPLP
tara:strand:- start:1190 stop:1345 length:156 start_codon:yes stop_codon:yes gene_type:complete